MLTDSRFSFAYFSWATGLLFLVNIVLAYAVFFQGMVFLSDENGIMENVQVAFLALACGVFLWQSRFLQKQNKLLAIFLSLLAFAFIFREIDVEDFAVPSWIIFIFAEKGRALYLAPLLWLFTRLVRQIPFFWEHKAYYLKSNTFIYMVLTAVIYGFISNLFDKKMLPVSDPYFFEEAVEIFATGYMLCAAVLMRRDFATEKHD